MVQGPGQRGDDRCPDGGAANPATNSWRTLAPMRTPRHGAAAGTINGVVYVVGGGTTVGSSFNDNNDAFSITG